MKFSYSFEDRATNSHRQTNGIDSENKRIDGRGSVIACIFYFFFLFLLIDVFFDVDSKYLQSGFGGQM